MNWKLSATKIVNDVWFLHSMVYFYLFRALERSFKGKTTEQSIWMMSRATMNYYCCKSSRKNNNNNKFWFFVLVLLCRKWKVTHSLATISMKHIRSKSEKSFPVQSTFYWINSFEFIAMHKLKWKNSISKSVKSTWKFIVKGSPENVLLLIMCKRVKQKKALHKTICIKRWMLKYHKNLFY